MSSIVSFYEGSAPDDYGRRIEDIWAFDDSELESTHDYIQRLFPTRQPSQFEVAPLLDDDTIETFQQRPELRQRLLRSLDLMLRFYGLQREGERVVKAANFPQRATNWISPHNHNYLRITRILTCLRLLGLGEWARSFFGCLRDIYGERGRDIGERSFNFWRSAAG